MSHIFSGYSVGCGSHIRIRRSANRRRREEARQRILDAARAILQGKPFRDLTVDELMSATGLSRTAFYRYFPDREAVLLELLEEVWGELADARDAEAVGADFDDATSMARLTELLAANQAVLKAITDAAPGDEDLDPPTAPLCTPTGSKTLQLASSRPRGTAWRPAWIPTWPGRRWAGWWNEW